MKKIIYSLVGIIVLTMQTYAQSTTILPGGGSFDNTTSLSTLKLPTLTYTQIKAIQNPTEGMVVYDKDAHCVRHYNGTKWICLTDASDPNSFQAPGVVQASTLATSISYVVPIGASVNSRDVVIDEQDNSYFIGTFSAVPFTGQNCGGRGYETRPVPTGYLMKYSASMTPLWCFSLMGKIAYPNATPPYNYYTYEDFFSYISSVVATNNDVYIAGNFNRTVTVNGTDYTADGIDAFIAKFNAADGQLQWFKKITSGPGSEGITTLILNNGTLYASGNFNSNITIDGTVNLTNNGGTDFFLAKFNDQGVIQASTSFGSANTEEIVDIAFTGGKIWAVGTFTNSLQMGTYNATGDTGKNMFIAKVSTNNFTPSALTSISTTGNFVPEDIIETGYSRVAISGSIVGATTINGENFNNNGFVLEANSSNSSMGVTKTFKLTQGKVSKMAHKQDKLYCTLYDLAGFSNFSGIPIGGANNAIVYLKDMENSIIPSGTHTLQWIKQIGKNHSVNIQEYIRERVGGVAIKSTGEVYIPYSFFYEINDFHKINGLKLAIYSE